MDYWYEKNWLNSWVDPTESGRMAAILESYYNIVNMERIDAPPSKWQW